MEDTNTSSCSTSITTKDDTHEPPVAGTAVQDSATTTSPVPAQLPPATSTDSLASVDVEVMETGDDTTTYPSLGLIFEPHTSTCMSQPCKE
ncbi:hypothetical protein Pcinc_008805 [Petrolisthes cinctipes]|uniref:Uncharacterized protein n=1 Tax=Petrolisthes cinctipes TaxID=88211 RepID=A0AAE1G6L0_PETCI|nr:hypothetical protein Pcinc_034722 [Petrolisthes cinctipes]KAK3887040.1 hypothetical protein Pcinc_008805 [Petrolisthes cinctipes]